MSAFVTHGPDGTEGAQESPQTPAGLPLTGERTVPGLDVENYWFRRHEVAYLQLLHHCVDRDVLEAGFGEGYGADLLAGVARGVTGVDYDESAVAHARARYPRVTVLAGNLAALPLPEFNSATSSRKSSGKCSRPMTVPGAAMAIAVASTLESWRRLPGH